jgi:hypothetical protein
MCIPLETKHVYANQSHVTYNEKPSYLICLLAFKLEVLKQMPAVARSHAHHTISRVPVTLKAQACPLSL